MMKLEYIPESEVSQLAQEVLEFIKPKELPVWQIKEIFIEASRLAEWQPLK